MASPLEQAPCGVCKSTDTEILFESPDRVMKGGNESFPVGKCRACAHVFLAARPPERDIGGYYPDGYEAHGHREAVYYNLLER